MFISGYANTENVFYCLIGVVYVNCDYVVSLGSLVNVFNAVSVVGDSQCTQC